MVNGGGVKYFLMLTFPAMSTIVLDFDTVRCFASICFIINLTKWLIVIINIALLKVFRQRLRCMAFLVVEFSREGYKIRKVFG